MIDYVSGKLATKKPTETVVDVGGIGYKLLIPTSTFEKLPAKGSPVTLLCHHYVREDAMLAVSGVGPKLALAALSSMRPSEIRDRILEGDSAMLTRIPGVGKKTAERIIIELRDRFEKTSWGESSSAGVSASSPASSFRMDAMAALEALGLSRSAAEKSVIAVLRSNPEINSAETLIRMALRS
jgi:holliday junction DNA helicase RuvA